jgi:hypothetical protein
VGNNPVVFEDPTGWSRLMALAIPALIGGGANVFFHRDQGEQAMAKAYLAGAGGGLLAGAVATGAAFVGATSGVAAALGTGTGGAFTKAANLSNCLDPVKLGYSEDIAFAGLVSGVAGLGSDAFAYAFNSAFQQLTVGELTTAGIALAETSAVLGSALFDQLGKLFE